MASDDEKSDALFHGIIGGVFALFFLPCLIGMCWLIPKLAKDDKEEKAKKEEQLINSPTTPPPMTYKNQRKCKVFGLNFSLYFFRKEFV